MSAATDRPVFSANLMENFEMLLKKLISFPTVSSTGNKAAMDWIELYLKEYGVQVWRFPTEYDPEIENLYAVLGKNVQGGVCFSGHFDVVPPQDEGWFQNPFKVQKKDDRYYGRGTSDMKGFLALILSMVPIWKEREPKYPIHIAITYDEEIGCKSVPLLITEMQKKGFNPEAIILGEPTECVPIYGHKGGAECTTVVHGMAGHASKPQRGQNAIYYAMDYIGSIRELLSEFSTQDGVSSPIDPPYTTLSVGEIRGGVARNVIPDSCIFKWEVRTLPGIDAKEVVHRLDMENQKRLASLEGKVSIQTTIEDSYPGLVPNDESRALSWVRSLKCDHPVEAVSFGTEAGYYDEAGIPTIIWGPGSIEQAHTVNEYLDAQQVQEYAQFLLNI